MSVVQKIRRILLGSLAWIIALSIPVLMQAIPAKAVDTGTIKGGAFYVELLPPDETEPIKAWLTPQTTVQLRPEVPNLNPQINNKGQITINNVPVGSYSVQVKFIFTDDDCDGFLGLIGDFAPGVDVGCQIFGETFTYSATKVFQVTVKAGQTAFLGGTEDTSQKKLGDAIKTDSDGNVVLECSGTGPLGGFVICPMVEALISGMQFALTNIIEPFLQIIPLRPINADGSPNAMFAVWDNLRNFTNILFIIIFFAIIFSQATSLGISNYGIKRLLPKLILFAILTNLSFFICALLVDLSNIFGVGVASLLTGIVLEGQPLIDVGHTGTIIAGALLALPVALIAAPFAIIAGFIFILIAAIILFVAAFVILLRQILLIFLIIVSPLAFAAAILPNTSNLFNRWFNLFGRLLIMYPLIMLLFALGAIGSSVLSQIGGITN